MSTALTDNGMTFSNGDTQAYPVVNVRQTVLSGPVDANGQAAFGGATGGTTVTAAGTLTMTAANGVSNRTGSKLNPSWTGLTTNGQMYLYADVNTNGTITEGVGTLLRTEQQGGTPSIVAGQHTFNAGEMVGYIGNGASAVAGYRVYVGECTVAGGVVTAIIWYALNGRYDSGYTNAIPISTTTSKNSNLGLVPTQLQFLIKCLTAEANYSVGDTTTSAAQSNGSYIIPVQLICQPNTVAFPIGITVRMTNKTTQVDFAITPTSWAYRIVLVRGW